MLAPRSCPGCGFSLAHAHAAHSTACPECGLAFDGPALVRLRDTGLWQRQRRAAHLFFTAQMLWALIIGIAAIVHLIVLRHVRDLDEVFGAEAIRVLDAVRIAAWMIGSWLLLRDLDGVSDRLRRAAILAPILFTVALGLQVHSVALNLMAPHRIPWMLGALLGLAFVATIIAIGVTPTRPAHAARRPRRRLGGRAVVVAAAFSCGVLVPWPARFVVADIVQLIAAFVVLVAQSEWSRTLRRERVAVGLAMLRPFAYAGWLVALFAMLFGSTHLSPRTPAGVFPPYAVWSALANVLFLTAVAIGIRRFHRSVRCVRRDLLEMQTVDQLARERLAEHVPPSPVTRLDVLAAAATTIAIPGCLGLVLLWFYGSWRGMVDARLWSVMIGCGTIALLSPVVLLRHGQRHSTALRCIGGTGLLLSLALVAIGIEVTRWDTTGWFAAIDHAAWPVVFFILGASAGTVALTPRRGWFVLRIVVAAPVLVLCSGALSIAAWHTDDQTLIAILVGLYALAAVRVLAWRVAPLRSSRLWYAITCARWWNSAAILSLIALLASRGTARVLTLEPREVDMWHRSDGLSLLQEQIVIGGHIALFAGMPLSFAAITLAAYRLRRQQARANLPFPHVGESQPE